MPTLNVLQFNLIVIFAVCSGSYGSITTTTTPTSMTVNWIFPQDVQSSIESYTVSLRYIGPCSGGPQPEDVLVESGVNSVTIGNLEEFSRYNVTVSASLPSVGTLTSSSTAVTRTAQPPAPQNVRSTGVTQTQVFLEWDDIPCLDRNADIEHYRIFGQEPQVGGVLPTGSSGRASYVVNNLSPDIEYSFFVYASYRDDNDVTRGGRNSRMIFVTTMEPFQTPMFVIKSIDTGPNDIHVLWETSGTLSSISHYLLSISYKGPCDLNSFPDISVNINNISITQHQVVNLEESSYFEVNVTLVQLDGTKYSRSTIAITEGESVIQPSIGAVIPNPDSITITWAAAAPGVCVASYEVTAAYMGPCNINNDQNVTVTTSGTSSSATLENLRVFSVYKVSVTAMNSVVQGSVSTVTQTGGSVPGAPTTVQSEFTSENTAVISWQHKCEDQHARIIAYTVTYGPASTFPEGAVEIQVNGSSHQTQLNNLTPNIEYRVQVFAVGQHTGSGIKSEIIELERRSTDSTEIIDVTRQSSESTDFTADQKLGNSNDAFSNSSVIIAIVVVLAFVLLGIIIAVVTCTVVVGLVSWKRTTSKKIILDGSPVTASVMELEDCMAYNTPYTKNEGHDHSTYSSRVYESIHPIDNIGYGKVMTVKENTANHTMRKNSAYDTLERI